MKAYSIFDDFTEEATAILMDSGFEVNVHPVGVPRPDRQQMQDILEKYDCIIIGTSQKIDESQFENVQTPKIIGTASVGVDHIHIPAEKKNLVTVVNAPKANAQSVAEYTIGCALACCKRLREGSELYKKGFNNKKLIQKPEDLIGKTMGVIGAGNISVRIMEYAQMMGMNVICWTEHPRKHSALTEKGIRFCECLNEVADSADFISVNLPNIPETEHIISSDFVKRMKNNAIFISVSRLETIDFEALFLKAEQEQTFYVCLDLDVTDRVLKLLPNINNVIVTPHIAGGTMETRKRMFAECASNIASSMKIR